MNTPGNHYLSAEETFRLMSAPVPVINNEKD
jgi:hypothetical protein